MLEVVDGIWAMDIRWDPVGLGATMNQVGDDFEYVYNEDAVAQVIHLAIRDSDYTPQMINAHPAVVSRLLNDLVDELEDNEWSIALGSIKLDMDFKTGQLIFTGKTDGLSSKPIRVALDLTKESI
jgi:hypothetical protein